MWIAATLTGCLVTDPVEFEEEVNVPPVLLDDPAGDVRLGGIVKVARGIAMDGTALPLGPIRLPVRIREENLSEVLRARTRLITAETTTDDPPPFECPEPEIPPSGSDIRDDFDVVVDGNQLAVGQCYRVELVVSGSFFKCTRGPSWFDILPDDRLDDIARATFWIWEVSQNTLGDPEAAKKLALSCDAVDRVMLSEPAPPEGL